MRLSELNPKWFAEAGRHGQGITFDCPHCMKTRLAVTFAPTLDGGAELNLGKFLPVLKAIANAEKPGEDFPGDVVPPGIHWGRTGDTFENLTLSPSVDASASGHWHGWVQNGNVG